MKYQIIIESYRQAVDKFGSVIPERDFDELRRGDPTRTKKYLLSMCEMYTAGHKTHEINTLILLFDKLCRFHIIQNTDIDAYHSFEDIQTVVLKHKKRLKPPKLDEPSGMDYMFMKWGNYRTHL